MRLDRTTPVNFEWALWGKSSDGPEYRVLSQSAGTVARRDFDHVLSHYSPGTLQRSELPQAIVSSFEDKTLSRRYVGLAIYSGTMSGDREFNGRDLASASYYCVPYLEFVQADGSYLTMYQRFSGMRLPLSAAGSGQVELTARPQAPSLDEQQAALAKRVAALLLTDKPVCVLGADHVEMIDRLGFVEAVASFLPFGMRASLSASTWASSTARHHQLRLFFAAADRRMGDEIVTWSQSEETSLDNALAEQYLTWLRDEVISPALLTEQAVPSGFGSHDVLRAMQALANARGQARPANEAVHALLGDPVVSGSKPGGLPDAGEVKKTLTACRDALITGDGQRLKELSEILHGWRDCPRQMRPTIRELAVSSELLSTESEIAAPELRSFYGELLRVAFTGDGKVMGYRDLRVVLRSLDYAAGRAPSPLLWAMLEVGQTGPVRLAVMGYLGDDDFESASRSYPLTADEIVTTLADTAIDRAEQDAACHAALRYLTLPTTRTAVDRRAFSAAMYRENLIPLLQKRYEDHPEYQFNVLTAVLRFAYSGRLSSVVAAQLFERSPTAPSEPLLFVVLSAVAAKDAPAVMQCYLRSSIRNSGLAAATREKVEQAISAAAPSPVAVGKVPPSPSSSSNDAALGIALILLILGITFAAGFGVAFLF
jgi:hypothetical protein